MLLRDGGGVFTAEESSGDGGVLRGRESGRFGHDRGRVALGDEVEQAEAAS